MRGDAGGPNAEVAFWRLRHEGGLGKVLRQWRRGLDLNPREACAPTRFPVVPLRPLRHISSLTGRPRPQDPVMPGRRTQHQIHPDLGLTGSKQKAGTLGIPDASEAEQRPLAQ